MIDKTARGFSKYGEFKDTYGATIRVQESSAVGPTKVWIFCQKDDRSECSPHLNVEQMKKLRDILSLAIEDAESPDNWRNSSDYIKEWG